MYWRLYIGMASWFCGKTEDQHLEKAKMMMLLEQEYHSCSSGRDSRTGSRLKVLCSGGHIKYLGPPLSLIGVVYASASTAYLWLYFQCLLEAKI